MKPSARGAAIAGWSGALAAALVGMASAACGQILGAYEYGVHAADASTDDDAGADDDAKAPPSQDARDSGEDACAADSWDAQTCWPCAPTTRAQLENACTTAECHPFDNTRVVGLGPGGALPVPPAHADAGAPADAGPPQDAGPPPDAGAGTACASLQQPVYVAGSSAIKPFLARVALAMAGQQKGTLVYQSQGSCVGVDAILNGTAMRGKGTAGASYWDPANPDPVAGERLCDLADAGNAVDLGVSDVFAATCIELPQGLPPNVGDFFGPVQVMDFVVPVASLQQSISAEAAYFVYGFGAQSKVSPWSDESLIFQRSATSGTQNMIAKTIGLPAASWLGKANKTSDDVRTSLLHVAAADADKAIGILSSDYADDDRAQLRVLAFQDYGQACGYWPDSTPTAPDKANVRDGHYPIWGPLHMLTRLDGQGLPLDAGVRTALGYLTGSASLPSGENLIQLYAQRHIVPSCAMHVTRTSDGGPLASYRPDQPCSCYFDSLVTGHSTCEACTTSQSCPATAPTCSYGFCER